MGEEAARYHSSSLGTRGKVGRARSRAAPPATRPCFPLVRHATPGSARSSPLVATSMASLCKLPPAELPLVATSSAAASSSASIQRPYLHKRNTSPTSSFWIFRHLSPVQIVQHEINNLLCSCGWCSASGGGGSRRL
jgi:hypothetical protein